MSGASFVQDNNLRRIIPMKKVYGQPQLTVHGNVEAITQFGGTASRKDVLVFSASVVIDGTGSSDFTATPIPRR